MLLVVFIGAAADQRQFAGVGNVPSAAAQHGQAAAPAAHGGASQVGPRLSCSVFLPSLRFTSLLTLPFGLPPHAHTSNPLTRLLFQARDSASC